MGTGGGADARLWRLELVADPLDRRPPSLSADLDLGEPRGLRALVVLGRDRAGAGGGHRPPRHPDTARLAHTGRRRVSRYPRSRGAIVKPAASSCSQKCSAGSRGPDQTIAMPLAWILSAKR